jgi:diaminopimelate epimerase
VYFFKIRVIKRLKTMKLQFYKYQATGNDFIIFDARKEDLSFTNEQISRLCDRRFGIGADGIMILKSNDGYDFEMEYHNADGTMSMCGNGGRSMVKFAHSLGIHRKTYFFLAIDGEHSATLEEDGWVNLQMKDVHGIHKHHGDFVLNTGSPHYIKPVTGVDKYDVVGEGKSIRYSDGFAKEGINVNFVEKMGKGIFVRTYERGVENETLSCGTGVTAAALVFANNDAGCNRVEVQTLGGHLAIEFEKTGRDYFENIWLCGPAEQVFTGEVEI